MDSEEVKLVDLHQILYEVVPGSDDEVEEEVEVEYQEEVIEEDEEDLVETDDNIEDVDAEEEGEEEEEENDATDEDPQPSVPPDYENDECSQYFTGSKFLPNLKQRHEEFDKMFTYHCDACRDKDGTDVSFPTYRTMRRHLVDKHKQRCMYGYCCNRRFTAEFMIGHLRHHLVPQERFQCGQCGKLLESELTLKRHLLSHEQCLQCKICNTKFKDKATLTRHQMRRHPVDCPECGELHANKMELYKHRRIEHPLPPRKYKPKDKSNPPVKKPPRKNMKPIPKKEMTCSFCDEVFVGRGALIQHKDEVHYRRNEEGRIMCSECDEHFATKSSMAEHIRAAHMDVQMDTLCPICGKEFKTRNIFLQHYKNVHAGPEDKTECPECGKWYPSKAHMSYHRRAVHTTIIQKCAICDYEAKYSRVMVNHMRRKHRLNVDGTPYVPEYVCCTICSAVFTEKRLLRQHMGSHSDVPSFACEFCPKEFKTAAVFYQHRKKHHPEEWNEMQERKRLRVD